MSSAETDSESEGATPPPSKRPRQTESSSDANAGNVLGTHAASKMYDHSAHLPPLSVSMLGVEPLDEFIREVADFVHHMIMTRPNISPDARVEVEAKLGVLKDTTGRRLNLPVLVETILAPDSFELRFETNMSPTQHKQYNTLLNNLVSSSRERSHPGSPLVSKHVKLVDSFYTLDNRDKVRVTRDEKNGQVLEIMKKMRLGNLNIYCPKRTADWRVSVNLEIPVSHPIGSPSLVRKKDRVCYSHEEFNVDLTQVTTTTGPTSSPEVSHELEVEIARSPLVLYAASKRNDMNAPEHERCAFDELIRSFVNNARILAKNATDVWR